MEKNVAKVTLTYEDGTVKDLEKAVVFTLAENPDADQVDITADMVNIAGRDLYTVVDAAVELGMRLGMFK